MRYFADTFADTQSVHHQFLLDGRTNYRQKYRHWQNAAEEETIYLLYFILREAKNTRGSIH